jgi:hypothetical protein
MTTTPPTSPVTDQLTSRLQRTEIQRAVSSIPRAGDRAGGHRDT